MSSFYDDASLVVIPSGYKTSKVYAEKPTDGSGDLTFTRTGDTATRVNSAGLIEKVRTNVATYSEDFSNAAWNKYQATITANSVLAPNGTTTADTITDNAVNDVHIAYHSISFPAGEYSVSCYAKANTLSHAFLQIYNGTNFYVSGIFNLTNGTVSGAGSITSVGNGWYRLSFTAQITAGVGFAYVGTSNGSTVAYVGTGQSIYIWGYQAETGVATAYIPTTTAAVSVGPVANVPRLDYLGSTCGKLLLEPQRTNLVTYSEQFDNAAWPKAQITTTANSSVSPDGYANADKIAIDNGVSGGYVYQSIATTSSTVYTSSFFIKASGVNFTKFYSNVTGSYVTAVINLTTGAITNSGFAVTPTATNYGNGWWRVSYTQTSGGGSIPIYVDAGSTSNGGTITGNGTDGVLIWGAQVEAGAYATSYIPTLAASATRGADACSKTGISSLIGQTEGVLFADFVVNALNNASNIFNSERNTNASFFLSLLTNGKIDAGLYASGSPAARITEGSVSIGQRAKVAYAYKSGSSALYINGTLVGTSAGTYTLPSSLDDLFFNDPITYFAYQENVSFNQALLFKTRLTNAELAELTTL